MSAGRSTEDRLATKAQGAEVSAVAVSGRAAAHPPEPLDAPIDQIDVSRAERFEFDAHRPFFARLRREAPVHFCAESGHGPYWSITRYADILAVDKDWCRFSSRGSVFIGDQSETSPTRAFIVMDPPEHAAERKAAAAAVTPDRLAALEDVVRARIAATLDGLPRDEPFDWVEKVSIELTTQMLATLFDFPWEERRLLPYWSDMLMATPRVGNLSTSLDRRGDAAAAFLARFQALWRARAAAPLDRRDFVSVLAHNPDTAGMIDDPMHLAGTMSLLLVGGNDTTRNSMTGGVVALNRHPQEWEKLKSDPTLVPNAAAEIIRWQTPLSHMRRTATEDVDLHGQTIRKGDRVVMWYCSGNRDAAQFEDADALRVDRANARSHLAFGFGIHRCMGNRVAEMQLRILWEEILKRFDRIELLEEPKRVQSNFVAGYARAIVRIAG